jgi:hypothetical protein
VMFHVQPAPGGPSVSCHAVFWTAAGKSLASVTSNPIQSDSISNHDTLSVATEPFHVLHMDPMGDVSMCSQLLVAHLCICVSRNTGVFYLYSITCWATPKLWVVHT